MDIRQKEDSILRQNLENQKMEKQSKKKNVIGISSVTITKATREINKFCAIQNLGTMRNTFYFYCHLPLD